MHDRAVRRRRAVLVALVAASLILLTAYFGESQDGRLHSVQRGALAALSPIQEGASRVLKPFRDLFGWTGDTIDAKDERDKAIAERDAYRAQLALAMNQLREAQQQGKIKTIDTTGGMSRYGPVDARVTIRSSTSWYQRFTINKGTDDGVHRGDPVINGAGLVGKVEMANGGTSVVTLITDPEFATGAIAGAAQEPGTVVPSVNTPGELQFKFVDNAAKVRTGDLVYTAGTTVSRLESRYPRAITIGRVSRIDLGDGELDRRVRIRPAADLKRVDLVQVLTEPHADLGTSTP
jgi:rod shape-determining protein MreC